MLAHLIFNIYLSYFGAAPITCAEPFKLDAPIIAVPVGLTTTRQPRIEWRSVASDSYQVLVTAEETTASQILWDSGIVESDDKWTTAVPQLPVNSTLYTHVRVKTKQRWTNWSPRSVPFRIQPVPQAAGDIITYDLSYSRKLPAPEAFGHAHLVSVLQGIVNRDQPQLFVNFVRAKRLPDGVDNYWLNRLQEPEGWLAKKSLVPEDEILALVNRFRSSIDGVVIWDPEVNATSNIASTVAGADNLLPVRYDPSPGSFYTRLVTSGPQLPVRLNLVGKFTGTGTIPDTARASSGSRKCDAYIWAVENYLKTKRSNPQKLGYYLDAYWISEPGGDAQLHTLTNHDYFVANKGFFWDLSPWSDETPVDDPDQPLGADLNTLKEIYVSSYEAMAGAKFSHTGGFTPWHLKYTNSHGAGGTHGAVETEWETARILSAYNSYLDADAIGICAMANASLYQHMPLPERYSQPVPPMPEELQRQGLLSQRNLVTTATYILHYVGDYDSAAWATSMLPGFWDAGDRGSVNMGWAINPNLSERAPMFFEYAYRTRTAHDHFMAGDSGAGYVNPTQLLSPRRPSGLPSAVEAWQHHCRQFYQAFGMNFTGFVINGLSGVIGPEAERIHTAFSPNGIVIQEAVNQGDVHLEGTMPVFVHNSDLSVNAPEAADTVHSLAQPDTLQFLMFRSILRPVSYYATLNNLLRSSRPDLNYVFCSPDVFSYLARVHLGSDNNQMASYLFDTIPQDMQAGNSYPVQIAIRNDGWDTWKGGKGGTHGLLVEISVNDKSTSPTFYPMPRDVPPGDSIVIKVEITACDRGGSQTINYEMASNNGANKFSSSGDPAFVQKLKVEI